MAPLAPAPAIVGKLGSTKPGCAARRPVRCSSTATSDSAAPAATCEAGGERLFRRACLQLRR